jgi:hypothetical protein
MSQQYDNELRGIIGKNDRKGDNERAPDIKGQCEILGVQYWISGWKKEKRDGSGSFYSLSFEPKETAPAKAAPAPKRQPARDDDDIPF